MHAECYHNIYLHYFYCGISLCEGVQNGLLGKGGEMRGEVIWTIRKDGWWKDGKMDIDPGMLNNKGWT